MWNRSHSELRISFEPEVTVREHHGVSVLGVSFDGEFDGLVSDGGVVPHAKHVREFDAVG